ncbi:MAG: S53 family peptidase [Patescibacteria group bacterium]|nr:S53 family peptidase [Patescibacteria group bacterium]
MIKKFISILVLSLILLTSPAMAGGLNSLPEAAQNHMSAVAVNHIPVCSPGESGVSARCHSRVVVDANGQPKATSLPAGFGPAQLRGAYNLSGTANTKQIIAIVDAYNDPNILSDLNTYSSKFGLPSMNNCAVSSATPCFQKVSQRGDTSYPSTNAGWSLEIALDVETAHALCQNCSILLVEADSNSFANLIAAEDRAQTMGANVISNSWGGGEFSSETTTTYDGHFNKPGIAITFSSGDSGYGVEYPAASKYVTAVGGTTLTLNGNNYVGETAWSGAGSGCSAYETQPSFQNFLNPSICSNRAVADVSADADPNSGAAVYDSVRYQGRSGWFKVGGTSLASPIIAATYALAGNTSTINNGFPYANVLNNLHDIISGSNGSCGNLLCTAVAGYDGPTGLGSPLGTNAF